MVFLLGSGSLRIVRTLLASYRATPSDSRMDTVALGATLGLLLRQADVQPKWLYSVAGLVCFLGVCVALWWGLIVGVVVIVVGLGIAYLRLRRRAAHRRQGIDRDLPALLTSVASSVRAGIDPLSALIAAREYLPANTVLKDELEELRRGLAAGRDEEELIEEFLSLYQHSDGELFKRCLILSRKHGGSLAEPLHRVNRVVRQRQSFRRKTRAALAMHRMSAVGIAVCATVIGGIQFVTNSQGLQTTMSHPTGSKFLMLACVLLCTGVGWMMTMGSEAKLQ